MRTFVRNICNMCIFTFRHSDWCVSRKSWESVWFSSCISISIISYFQFWPSTVQAFAFLQCPLHYNLVISEDSLRMNNWLCVTDATVCIVCLIGVWTLLLASQCVASLLLMCFSDILQSEVCDFLDCQATEERRFLVSLHSCYVC